MAWTKQQQNAIDVRDRGLIVSAAAGSGKTSVLVERLTKLISDRAHPIPAERMIVVTYTNDAAAEIRQRLSLSLEHAIADAPSDEWLRRQQMLLSGAHISTINAFCFDFIREHIGDGELTASFRILDDAEQELLCAKAADTVIARWHSERPEDMRLLWEAFCGRNDAPLETILLDFHTFFGSIPFRSLWLKKTLAAYAKPKSENHYFQNIIQKMRTEIAAIRKIADHALLQSGDLYEKNNNVYDWILSDYDSISMLYKHLFAEEPHLAEICRQAELAAHLHDGKRYPTVRRKEVSSLTQFDAVKELRAQYKERFKKLYANILAFLPYYEEDLERHMTLLPLLAELEQDLSDVLWQMKCEMGGLGFDDGERLMLELLSEVDADGMVRQSALAKEMADYYSIIMIDECQDSNNKEDYIFKLLSKNCIDPETGAVRYGDNVFLVGDVKQCIYQFRMANPKNFAAAASSAEPFAETCSAPLQLIRLSQNFRSSGQVIAFVNYLFSQLMSEQCGDINYDAPEWLYAGALDYDKLPEEEQAVEVVILPEERDDSGKCMDAGIAYTAHTIRKMLKEGYPVMQRDGSKRPCTPSDFCVLVRTKAAANAYAAALESVQIPAKGVDETGYLHSKEISLLLNLLRVLDNPLLETPLAAVMLSPMFSFTADDLARVRLVDKNRTLYASLCLLLEDEAAPDALREKCRSLHAILSQLRYDSALYSLETLIRRIYETTDFLSVMQLYRDGEKKRANLHLLLQYARQYETSAAQGSGGITGFLRYVDSMDEKNADFKQASSSGGSDDVVSVKTMHGAKGLEFPFVFVCRTETDFSTLDNQKKLHCTDSGLAGFRLQNPETLEKYASVPYHVIMQEKQMQLHSEELRLLYVALTRAKQKLFLPMRYGTKEQQMLTRLTELLRGHEEIPSSVAANVHSMAEWLWMALLMRCDDGFTALVPEAEMMKSSVSAPTFPQLHVHYTNVYEGSDLMPEVAAPMPAPREEVLSELRRMTSHTYHSEKLGQVSLLSVSAISKASTAETLTMKQPRCVRTVTHHLTGAEHGSAVHAFFQYCRFSLAEKDALAEVRRLHEAGYLTEEEMKTIRAGEIEPFFRSSLYARIRRADVVLRERKFLVRLCDLAIPETLPAEELQALLQYRTAHSMMKGIIDLAFLEEDGYVLADYKTDVVSDAQELMHRYRMQLYIYRLALEQMTGRKVHGCCIYSTHLHKEIWVD